MNDENRIKRQEASLSNELGCKIENLHPFSDGFSFTVQDELDAYKAAYRYRYAEDVYVKYAPNVNVWLVQVYTCKD
jgi:hypothetical protein